MTAERRPQSDAPLLEIALDSGDLPVSNLSSLLRVAQAALREVARNSDDFRDALAQQPAPVLHLSTRIKEGDLVLGFTFTDPSDSTPIPELSAGVSRLFMERFGQFVKEQAQRNLWGEQIGGVRRKRYDSEVTRRLDQLSGELRRFPKARLRFDRQTILFEGDRVEIV